MAERIIASEKFMDALVAAGILSNKEHCSRVVIDLKAGGPVVIHARYFGDTRLLDVVESLDGAQVENERPLAEIWAVVVGNYEPPEVLALYDNEPAALAHAVAGEGLNVVAWTARSEYVPSSVDS